MKNITVSIAAVTDDGITISQHLAEQHITKYFLLKTAKLSKENAGKN